VLAGSSKQQAERDRTRGYGQPGQQQGLAGAAGGYEQQAQQVPMHPVQQQQMGGYPPQQQPQGDYGYGPGPAGAAGMGGPPIQQGGYAQEQPFQQQPQQGYEMQNVGNGGPGLGPGSSLQAFFAEIETINQSLQQLKENITQINVLHNTVLNSTTNEQRQEQAQRDLEGLTNDTSRLTNSIKLRIKNLSELNDKMPNVPGNEGEKNTRRLQVAAQKKKFMDYIQEYREVERNSREKYRTRMERQYKIVKPDATQEEIKYAMDNDQGSQVFASALTQSTRYADARNAYREVQERHEDIKRIAATMLELQQLFNDMAMLVERQDEQIQTIEATANNVENTMEGGHKEIEKGVKSAKKARRKRWICFWVLIVIIIAIVLAVTLSILSNQGKL